MFTSSHCAGNRQAKAKALIEASGLPMIAVEDFDSAAETVITVNVQIVFYICVYVHVCMHRW